MVSTPFLMFYIVGMTLETGAPYTVKAGVLGGAGIALHLITRYVFDERLVNVLPMSVYLATKVNVIQLYYFFFF